MNSFLNLKGPLDYEPNPKTARALLRSTSEHFFGVSIKGVIVVDDLTKTSSISEFIENISVLSHSSDPKLLIIFFYFLVSTSIFVALLQNTYFILMMLSSVIDFNKNRVVNCKVLCDII